MCGKSGMNSSSVSITSEDEGTSPAAATQRPGKALINGVGGTSAAAGGDKAKVNKRNETPQEKLKRRKKERQIRNLGRKKAKGILLPAQSTPKKVLKQFTEIWERETGFVNQLMGCLPEVRQPGILLEEEERTEEYITQGKDSGRNEAQEREMTKKFFAKVRNNLKSQGMETTTERATSYQELKERLHRKIAELATKPNEEKREKKIKKKLRQAKLKEEKSNKGKKLISQSASSAGTTENATSSSSGAVKEEVEEKKTPLKKKPVVKSNGEIVYSKFDFINSDTSRSNGAGGDVDFRTSKGGKKGATKGSGKPSAEELLKKAEKHEKKISNLATLGKKSEAVDLAQSQKWDTALKRAEGQKVRDDPHLLKKTIKKMDKQKQVTKKKWKERVERVEKLKEARQQKRQTNIQARRDDKQKRTKKLMRKKGRIA